MAESASHRNRRNARLKALPMAICLTHKGRASILRVRQHVGL